MTRDGMDLDNQGPPGKDRLAEACKSNRLRVLGTLNGTWTRAAILLIPFKPMRGSGVVPRDPISVATSFNAIYRFLSCDRLR